MGGRDRQNPAEEEGGLDGSTLLGDDVGEFGKDRDIGRSLERSLTQQALGFHRIADPQGHHRLVDDEGRTGRVDVGAARGIRAKKGQ